MIARAPCILVIRRGALLRWAWVSVILTAASIPACSPSRAKDGSSEVPGDREATGPGGGSDSGSNTSNHGCSDPRPEGDADVPGSADSDTSATDCEPPVVLGTCGDDQEITLPAGGTPTAGGPSSNGATLGVRLDGRFDTSDPFAAVAAWPGVRILARFAGTCVAARLEERTLAWQQGGPSEMDVKIDGTWRAKTALLAGEHSYLLADQLAAGEHEIELYRRSEAQNGTTIFHGFVLGDGALLTPPSLRSRRIEVIGDSSSTGFGVLGVGLGPDCPGPDWASRYQNFRLSWGAILGERLNAEVNGTSASGKGIVRNIWREDALTMPLMYPRVDPFESSRAFDLSLFAPDVVLLMMGGNDYGIGQPVDDGPLDPAVFNAALDDFIALLRTAYPNAHIVLVLSPSIDDVSEPGRLVRTDLRDSYLTVRDARAAAGDSRIHFVEPATASLDELTGCNGHGSPEFHERMADELEVFVRGLVGW